MDTMIVLLVIMTVLASVLAVLLVSRKTSKAPPITLHSSIQSLRSIGQLSVFKAITKEIVTETDHTWGDFGKKYLTWMLSTKKMAMIFEFEIDFRFDLRRPEFEIIGTTAQSVIIKMPPCFYEARIRDIQFYDEQKAKLLPWLLPDLLNGFISNGFTEEDKNKLVAAARAHAESQARMLIGNLQSEVQNSAKATLQSLARAFGIETVAFEFLTDEKVDITINVAKAAA